MIVIINEKHSVSEEYAKVLKINQKGKGCITGFSPVLNDDVTITWARGHLVTLSDMDSYDAKYKKWNLKDLPFLPDTYKYDVISDCKEQFNVIKALYHASGTGTILYAGDSAREGLYIMLLIRQKAGVKKGVTEKVVWIDSQTEEEIIRGIREAKPLSEYELKGHAAYMRAIEDFAVGINFTRALSCKYGYALNQRVKTSKWRSVSVGRVMSCVLNMIVSRENEIRNFKETPFYRIESDFGAEWKATEGSKFHDSPLLYCENGFREKSKAETLLDVFNADPVLVAENVNITRERKGAPLLFNLAEMQNFCTKKYKISPDRTLEIIQSLYEKKLVTYPRTDARVLSSAVAKEVYNNLKGLSFYKPEMLKKIMETGSYKKIGFPYVDDSKISDHYAIIPTGKTEGYNNLPELEKNVYHDIIERFYCIFLPNAEYDKLEIVFKHSSGEPFYLSKKVLKIPGWREVIGDYELEELPDFEKGAKYQTSFLVKEGKTTAPKRYTSGSMIIAMENAGKLIEDEELRSQIKTCGIGTSATRAEIIKKLVRTEYVNLNEKTQILTPTMLGEYIVKIVSQTCPSLLSPEMTANWEMGLQQIENGDVTFAEYKTILETYVKKEVARIENSNIAI